MPVNADVEKSPMTFARKIPCLCASFAALLASASASAQTSLDDLNLQFHGYAAQGFLFTTHNNILTTTSSNGSAAWTEAVVNLTAAPQPKLSIAVQARYSLIGDLGNAITLDFAAADCKINDKIGLRFGKVKTPSSLYNSMQDIDPAFMWSLLPQSVYPLLSRNSLLALYGGVAYGTLPLGEKFGKILYGSYGGQLALNSSDGFLIPLKDQGLGAPNGFTDVVAGGSVRWKTPLRGLLVSAADSHNGSSDLPVTAGGGVISGSFASRSFNNPTYSISYDHSKLSLASEYTRIPLSSVISLPAPFPYPRIPYTFDNRGWYAMASYKVTDKLSAGVYHSQFFNHAAALGPARFSKDWALSGRYDMGQYVYAKAEQHFIDGTAVLYDTTQNTGGLKPDTRLSLLKIGVSF
jgi:hypothetical protein